MTINLLSQRIKSAKRELTNLKTAHKRGLGNLKIFKNEIIIDTSGHTSGIYFLTININFDQSFASFPLIKIYPTVTNNFDYSAQLLEMDYINNGYTVRAEFLWLYNSSLPNQNMTVFSTSPISSSSYSWRNI